ncbi:MAG: hypothetical protein V4580_10990 [Bacteroidota bacterium]
MKTLAIIFFLAILISCNNKQVIPRHTHVFSYVSNNKDTVKFYGYKNVDTAIYYAKQERKKILLIFSGYACMAIPGREWETLSLYDNKTNIENNFVIAWLAVDETAIASDTNQVVFWYGKQTKLKTAGYQNKYLQEQLFKTSTQPLFCFIDTTKRAFGETIGYTRSKDAVNAFINSGLKK